MDNDTFKSRLMNLVSRSRKALRLYSNVGRIHGDGPGNNYTELQTREWKSVTADLLKELTSALDHSKTIKDLAALVYSLRDRLNSQWRTLESDLHLRQKELVFSSENGDFIRASVLATELVVLKARMQAAQAAHHELHDVLKRSKMSQPTIELSHEAVVAESSAAGQAAPETGSPDMIAAKVIPIRRTI